MIAVDLNCDMGEGIGNDAAIMPYISSASIACGFHAGDYTTITSTAKLAIAHGVSIGAHPSYPDKENFGRSVMNFSAHEIYEMVLYQVGAVDGIVRAVGGQLSHVKPHGALYNTAATNRGIAEAIVNAVKDFNSSLCLFGLSNSLMIEAAKEVGLDFKNEAFADRTYQDDGSLTPRNQPGALITSEKDCIKQVLGMIKEKSVTTLSGKKVTIQADTICFHGDGQHAVQFVQLINETLKREEVQISYQ